jgi:ATP adenylyltransferase
MQYVGGGAKETGCIFCNRLAADDDVTSLILHRASKSFVIMNLFPYSTGHVMLVPNQHVASPEEADPSALEEMATLLPILLRVSRRVLSCHGFNVGLNVGSVAGAGVADHMHQHVVPRWNGDASFMPIIGGVTVMPELIPVTYAKLRAELARDLGPTPVPDVTVVVLDADGQQVLLDKGRSLPTFSAQADVPVWRSAVDLVAGMGIQSNVVGWAGANRAEPTGGIALALSGAGEPTGGSFWKEIEQASAQLPEDQSGAVEKARHQPASMTTRGTQ